MADRRLPYLCEWDGKRPKRPVLPITDNATFYSVTKNLADPQISDPAVWQLEITGDVANPMTLSFSDLKALPADYLRQTSVATRDGVVDNGGNPRGVVALVQASTGVFRRWKHRVG